MRYGLGGLALVFGLFFAGCEVRGTWEFLFKDQGEINYIVLAGAGIAAALSLLPAWAALAWHGRRMLSCTLWVMFAVCLCTVISAAISRTGASTDVAQGNRETQGIGRSEAIKARDGAEADVAMAQKALNDARAEVVAQAALKTCAFNCAKLLADAVTNADADLQRARHRLDIARSQIVEAPPAKPDSLSKRIAALLPFVTEDQVRLYQPVAVPVLTSTLSALLMALGIWALFGVHRLTDQKPQNSDPTKDSAASRAPIAVATTASIAVPPAQPLAAPVVAPGSVKLEPVPVQRLQIEGPARSPVTAFAGSSIVREGGRELHLRDARKAYEKFCKKTIQDPLELPAFIKELASLCERSGIPVRVEGKDVFLVGARLADG